MNKKLVSAIGLGLMAAVSSFATSVTLVPGAPSVAPGNNTTAPGSVVATTQMTSGPNAFGTTVTVTEYVVNNGGVYDFYYEVMNATTSSDNLSQVAITNYNTTPSVAVANNTATLSPPSKAAGTIFANEASQDTGRDTVNFNFTNSSGDMFAPGTTSEWLEIDTNATSFVTNATEGATVTDGTGIIISGLYGPGAATPEPATLGLLGGGLALLGIARWRRSKKA